MWDEGVASGGQGVGRQAHAAGNRGKKGDNSVVNRPPALDAEMLQVCAVGGCLVFLVLHVTCGRVPQSMRTSASPHAHALTHAHGGWTNHAHMHTLQAGSEASGAKEGDGTATPTLTPGSVAERRRMRRLSPHSQVFVLDFVGFSSTSSIVRASFFFWSLRTAMLCVGLCFRLAASELPCRYFVWRAYRESRGCSRHLWWRRSCACIASALANRSRRQCMSPPPTLDMGLIKAGAEGVLAPSKTEDGNAMSNSADEEEKRVLQELEEPQRSRDSGLVFAVMSPSMVRVHRQLIDRGLGKRAHVCVACVCVLGRGRFYVCVCMRARMCTRTKLSNHGLSLCTFVLDGS